jgi:hypothetical protein
VHGFAQLNKVWPFFGVLQPAHLHQLYDAVHKLMIIGSAVDDFNRTRRPENVFRDGGNLAQFLNFCYNIAFEINFYCSPSASRSSSVYIGPLLKSISCRMIAKLNTSPFCVPQFLTGCRPLLSRRSSGAVHSISASSICREAYKQLTIEVDLVGVIVLQVAQLMQSEVGNAQHKPRVNYTIAGLEIAMGTYFRMRVDGVHTLDDVVNLQHFVV